ncbi:MAG: hypothetical protein V3V49_08060, partial [Candidatus Krumholzibacteria bacterium]
CPVASATAPWREQGRRGGGLLTGPSRERARITRGAMQVLSANSPSVLAGCAQPGARSLPPAASRG